MKKNKKKNLRSKATTKKIRSISEGNRIYQQMEKVMLSVDPSISGTVAMNYALSKLIANYKLAMIQLDIDVDDYMKEMVDWWVYRLIQDDGETKQFDAFIEKFDN